MSYKHGCFTWESEAVYLVRFRETESGKRTERKGNFQLTVTLSFRELRLQRIPTTSQQKCQLGKKGRNRRREDKKFTLVRSFISVNNWSCHMTAVAEKGRSSSKCIKKYLLPRRKISDKIKNTLDVIKIWHVQTFEGMKICKWNRRAMRRKSDINRNLF